MMPGHASRCRIIRIIITDHQTIYRNIHFSALYKFRPSVNGFRKFLGGCRFPVYHIKSQFFQKVHPLSPRYHRLIQMHQCKCMKPDMACLHFCRIFQIQRSGCQISRICIFFIVILNHVVDLCKICIGYGSFSSHNQMPLIRNLLRESSDRTL